MQRAAVANKSTWHFVKPDASLGFQVAELIKRCPPLDHNSTYCNLLQCLHFANTSIAALDEQGQVVGFVSGYIVPERPYCLFIWQVAVDPQCRGMGLAINMLMSILRREYCRDISFIETSITLSNKASWTIFKKLTEALQTQNETTVLFDQLIHFNGQHDTEMLVRIGPFNR